MTSADASQAASSPAVPAADPPAVPPETKDWTWVIEKPCPECGLDPAALAFDDVATLLLADVPGWRRVLAEADAARRRPQPQVWSPLEYACHVRDVCRLFRARMTLMLTQDDPLFANWDQDATAVEERYDLQEPAVVADELAEAAQAMAGTLRAVTPDQYARPGRRSNGSRFTVDTIARYFLHDVAHHSWDVGIR